MEENLPELVRDWKLETTFRNNQTVHTRFITNPTKEQWRSRIEEIWQRKQQLGCGGFGVVWLEECMSGSGTGQVRAVKQLRKAMSPSWPKELEAVFKFSHPRYRDSFIESFGWFDNEDDVCITMEYCPLGDLAKCVARPLPESEASLVTVQILEGVKYMHENNFTHRDLKPSNILVLHQGPKWWIKICDFGISKRTEGTSLWTQVGTEAYLAPEIRGLYTPSDMPVRGNKIFSLAVDIWAIGVIAHFISTGRMPFQDTMELIRYVQGTPFPDDSSLSTDCRTFMAETMKASPKQRPTAKDALSFAWLQQHLGTTNPNIDHLIQDVSNMHLQNRGDPYMLTPASGQWSTLNLLSPPSGELIPRYVKLPSPSTDIA
ncbi:kinase-like domain-containing protein [Lasiosphaeria ovina]|uniref:Autophagy-related protein 1 n=1 Tax=Lasiosphaeria ovina TaxID=92902 RepID=A0AAE0KCQ2_9PEZI|nr:kinase-like domain-containing protein [Lasiosphaeria ovina]